MRSCHPSARGPVHPRGCGEQTSDGASVTMTAGSSPRVRGTDWKRRCAIRRQRFIPAGAGNRQFFSEMPYQSPVHPRGCGEQKTQRNSPAAARGSSPRVRGTGLLHDLLAVAVRFIPAGAGNSNHGCSMSILPPVHPRGCGEQVTLTTAGGTSNGSSPRVRGTDLFTRKPRSEYRFIPAGAGNRAAWLASCKSVAVHPRGCGEQEAVDNAGKAEQGSSPRVRGTGRENPQKARRPRFIPAGAGNRIRQARCSVASAVHPRGCGEQLTLAHGSPIHDGSSPRVRGTANHRRALLPAPRFIPAGAGNRPDSSKIEMPATVHPRGCGEQGGGRIECVFVTGSSPRVRGTGSVRLQSKASGRFIPAGAGNSGEKRRSTVTAPVHPRGCGEQQGPADLSGRSVGSSPRVRGTATPSA